VTIVASSTPGQQPAARPRAAAAPGPLALAASPLIALSRDPQLLAAVRLVTVPGRAVRTAGSEVDLSAALVAGQTGVVLIDGAALVSPIATLTQGLHTQFPELVLIVAGGHDEQGKLAAQISDGTVYRFLHKPVSEQRVRLFVEAAWRRYEQDDPLCNAATASLPAWPPRRGRRALFAWLALAAAVTAAVPLLWLTMNEDPGTAPPTSAARGAASAPVRDAALALKHARAPEPEQAAPLGERSVTRSQPAPMPAPAAASAPTPPTAVAALTAATSALTPEPTAPTPTATAPTAATAAPPTPPSPDTRAADDLGGDADHPALVVPAVADADPTRVAALHDQAVQQRDAGPADSLAQPAPSFDEARNAGAAEDGAREAGSVLSESALARTYYVTPEFPLLARQRGIEGWVDLEFLVDSDGAVSDVAVIGAQPVGIFEQAALDAVRHWRYRPVMRDGHGVSQRARVRLRFAMQQP
jgi:TonB family protein